jgi:hypothetical protein
MRRPLVLAAAALAPLTAAPLGGGARTPIFTVSIEGTQQFEWTLDAALTETTPG